ncbi:receptor-like serine/threonine-protein kinase ALE2 isoform X2 [Malania oleifera]|uniref:receptor-like serine/threonine-protein kinase ALE2 isoform X2 n=1 Tax=Malania oleifera TaxID=397392 RepID=UPI0025AEC1F0|nr:receptor-like serine/threonine-protein kinase ALE2 isoform X2 [Malania oleifera]
MGMLLIILLLTLSAIVSALSVHGSADLAIFPTNPVSFGQRRHGIPVAAPPNRAFHSSLPTGHSHSHTRVAPLLNDRGSSSIVLPPSMSSFRGPSKEWVHRFASSPSSPYHRHRHHARNTFSNSASQPSYLLPPPTYSQQGPLISPIQSPFLSPTSWGSAAPAPSPTMPSNKFRVLPPASSPLASYPPHPLVLTLPPPPPNEDCTSVACTEPLTYTPPGSPCGCVWPIQVRLSISVALYTFFPLVSELANEIAAGVSLYPSQVRIMGANAATQEQDKTIVLINLIPLGAKFDDAIAFSTYQKFWHKQISIRTSIFGAYEAIYVRYPGLPPSPPSVSSSIASMEDGPYTGRDNNGTAMKPLGVEVPKTRRKKYGLGGSTISIIAVASVTAFVICMGAVWLLLLKYGNWGHLTEQSPHDLESTHTKPSGTADSLMCGNKLTSASMSLSSCLQTYTGSAKTLSINDVKRATNNFDASRILGEGGFGLVYSGILDDGRRVAVKILKREDQQGSREFLAEVEMLSRLHHRNLVKLIGICIEDHTHCLLYELVPNGSVESHLHGFDKETDPLDWGTRMKIALGAARGLAYLHEDSSPHVIHRDFKSSNILLEHDFTPKVSDFGLARTALDEGNKHISTHVMGTFGYLAPEYAMTGHLLVKSDVYSYGVVLLELLTGRKPVDLSQPPGQENLVGWARSLLTSKEGLETIIDPALTSNIPFDSVAKVAAIASMCVQPEVSHRPFMGEVVQALKLVCDEFDETNEIGCSQKDSSTGVDTRVGRASGNLVEVSETHYSTPDHDARFETKISLSTTNLKSMSVGFEGQDLGSTVGRFSSGPLRTGRRRQFWKALRGLSRGSVSEHGFASKLWPGSH